MKYKLALFIFSFGCICYAQKSSNISTMDFVQILNDNRKETLFYYENNWKVLRDMAIQKGYIKSFQILETEAGKNQPFHLILITTYTNKEQYEKRENRFTELIEAKGGLELLNDKKPNDFRKIVFSKEHVVHLY